MSDNNSSGKFVSADTTKIANFEKQSAEVITEFAAVKNEFNRINKEITCFLEAERRSRCLSVLK